VGINLITLDWLERLVAHGVLRGGSILDLGPQDLNTCPRAFVERVAARMHPPVEATCFVQDIFYAGSFRKVGGTPALYRMLGFEHYRSTDLMDSRADWHFDLNEPIQLPETFDVITNFGTAEHVFDIAKVFRFVHDTLKLGGVALHALPAFGQMEHGFFNIHPTTYFDLAAANGYAIEDIAYLDSIHIRSHLQLGMQTPFDFDALPIQRAQLQAPDMWGQVIRQYLTMLTQHGPALPNVNTAPSDLLCIALRKQADQPFRNPIQGDYRTVMDDVAAKSMQHGTA
jgi:SAM-dependent methyltransferase